MKDHIESILLDQDDIREICKRLGNQIDEDYQNKNPMLVGLLKGCVPFIGDLGKYITIPIEMEYMDVSSYHGAKSSLEVKILKDLDSPVKGRHVLIAEDIVDTGFTLTKVIQLLKYRGAASVEVVTLLNKEEGRLTKMVPKYIGQEIPNRFVVGYGLDYNQKYRNLPYVGILKQEIYE
ncbi:hypoxanthine phosphoribosyltransferase [Mycoplasmatota bacterium]|nr:hypoxanthine phosphoribosyltransferase [Mycoplasmatota bacterium]